MNALEMLNKLLKDNSSNKGKWLKSDDNLFCYCSECKQIAAHDGEMPFCAWCGAENAEHEHERVESAEWEEPAYHFSHCSSCGHVGIYTTPFCGYCGARMSNYGNIDGDWSKNNGKKNF